MTIIVIICCMFLTAGVTVRFFSTLMEYKGKWTDILDLVWDAAQICALAYIFTLLAR